MFIFLNNNHIFNEKPLYQHILFSVKSLFVFILKMFTAFFVKLRTKQVEEIYIVEKRNHF